METLQPLSEEGRNAVSFPVLSKSWMEFGGAGTSRVIPEMDGAAMVTQLVFVRGKNWRGAPCTTSPRQTGNQPR